MSGFIQAIVADLIIGGLLFGLRDLIVGSGNSVLAGWGDILWGFMLIVFLVLPWVAVVGGSLR